MTGITARNLSKKYGDFTAVDSVSLDVDEGEVLGIIGPNGAGKTTTLKMLAGLITPSSGEAVVAGRDSQADAMRENLGFLPEESPLYDEMTAHSYLEFFARLYDVPRDVASQRITRVLDDLELEHRDRRIGNMSKGMTRKVAIARSLVNDPEVLIYDEPASGLDPLTTNQIVEFTRELASEGKTILFSAHNLHQVETVCDRVAIMNEGAIIARGTLDAIRSRHGTTEYQLIATVDIGDATQTTEGQYRYVVESLEVADDLREEISAAGGDVVDFRTNTSSLEEIFLELSDDSEEGETSHQLSSDSRGMPSEALSDGGLDRDS